MKDLLKNKSGTNYFENSYAAYMKKDGIIYILFKDHLVLNHNAAQQILRDRLKFQSYTSYYVICDVSGIKSIDEDARDFLASKGSYDIKAVALISHKSTTYEMGTFYTHFNRPNVPTNVFTTLDSAVKFIQNLSDKP